MDLTWMGEYPQGTFFYGINGEDNNYMVVPSNRIKQLMDDKSISFTGLGDFDTHPTEDQIVARIYEIKDELVKL